MASARYQLDVGTLRLALTCLGDKPPPTVGGRPATLPGLHDSPRGQVGAEARGATLYWNGARFGPAPWSPPPLSVSASPATDKGYRLFDAVASRVAGMKRLVDQTIWPASSQSVAEPERSASRATNRASA